MADDPKPAEEKKEEPQEAEAPKEAQAEEPKPEAKADKPEPKAEEKPEEKEEAPKPEPAKKEEAPAEPKAEEKPEEKEEAPKPGPAKKEEAPAEPKPEEKKPEPKAEEKPEEKEEKVVEKPAKKEEPKDEPKAEEKPKPKVVGIPPNKLLLFDRYDLSDVTVTDAGLARYINLDPVMVPHTGARHANRPFAKGKMNIVERLVNNMMRTEDYTGKKSKTYSVVMDAFEIIEQKTKKNPVQVLIDALENATPREEVTRLRYGGVSVPKAVDVSSSRRLDIALRNICKGAVTGTYKNTKSVEICLANELMMAAKGDMNSAAVSKKEEIERIAASAR